mmetsp:Transcript_76222/g.233231  ORF Transcript_76222/g.233231 Transcript_76222/m.233231 type:complete len:203 (+) Transcript_76222:412-1020(+)
MEPGPPSSQSPSPGCSHVSVHRSPAAGPGHGYVVAPDDEGHGYGAGLGVGIPSVHQKLRVEHGIQSHSIRETFLAHWPKPGTHPCETMGRTKHANAKPRSNQGKLTKNDRQRQRRPAASPCSRMFLSTRAKGLSSGSLPSCATMLGPAPSSFWYSDNAQMNITSVSDAVLPMASRKSSAFSDHACEIIKFTSNGLSPLTSNA